MHATYRREGFLEQPSLVSWSGLGRDTQARLLTACRGEGAAPVLTALAPLPRSPALLAIAASGRADEAWDKVVTAAKQEGSVTVYNGATFVIPRAIGKAFERTYGIHVDIVEARPSDVKLQIRVEE